MSSSDVNLLCLFQHPQSEPAVLSLPSSDLLEGGDLLDSYLKLQYDELLDDHPLLLRPATLA